MTPTRYFLARTALAFGISRKQRRMAEAANETHLLREAEQLLGERVWNRVEQVEELGIEYWNLRRLVAEKKEIREKLIEAEDLLAEAHDQRASLLSEKSATHDELSIERAELLQELDELARDRDAIVNKARGLRRLYDGMKTKLEVLKSESREDQQTTATTRARMSDLRSQFEALKEERDRVAALIEKRSVVLDQIDDKIDGERTKHRSEAAEAFQMIGEANRRISSFKAELGLLDTQMNQLYGEIGRHVSRNTKINPHCREASGEFGALVEVMRALRRSINLNHRLAGN